MFTHGTFAYIYTNSMGGFVYKTNGEYFFKNVLKCDLFSFNAIHVCIALFLKLTHIKN